MKYYVKMRCTKHIDDGWRIDAGDLDASEDTATIAYLDTETLADALMQVLTQQPGPFVCGKVYDVVDASPADTREWQSRTEHIWVFGEKVRGAVRMPAAAVANEGSIRRIHMENPCRWCTYLGDEEDHLGYEENISGAMAAAEAALGVT